MTPSLNIHLKPVPLRYMPRGRLTANHVQVQNWNERVREWALGVVK
jgi:hypothetical protein